MAGLIEDYAIVGGLRSATLISRDGSADWLCAPRFDSPACFAALLGDERHGHWLIAPTASRVPGEPLGEVTRRYQGDTLILETNWRTVGGVVRVIDFMPPLYGDAPVLVRIVEGVAGAVEMECVLRLRFGYGQIVPWMRKINGALVGVAGPDSVWLRTPVKLTGREMAHQAGFVVREGERVPFALSWVPSHLGAPAEVDVDAALQHTREFWTEWAGRCTYSGRYRDAVVRSLITLKALTYEPTGGIVAAPTTSLPEDIGGIRNWDYRYCWLRDSGFTLWSLYALGFDWEADDFFWFLADLAQRDDELQVVYGVDGERDLTEQVLDHLSGYEGARPVRAGNAAYTQPQHDVWGTVLQSIQIRLGSWQRLDDRMWTVVQRQVECALKYWREPDCGIWEVRGQVRHFTFSKLMCWSAAQRGAHAARARGDAGLAKEWQEAADEMRADILEHGLDQRGAFTQHYETTALDASLLLLPMTGFLPRDDPRVRTTVLAIADELTDDGLVLRYRPEETDDGLSSTEGTFTICSFMLVSALCEIGETQRAQHLCERLLSLASSLDLYAEEIDPSTGRQLGNFPQAFTHLALINAVIHVIRAQRRGRPDGGGGMDGG